MELGVNKSVIGAMVSAIAFGAPAVAADQDATQGWLPGSLTGNVALTSDYVFRGISQTNNGVAAQGGLDWDTGAGIHVGTWASSLNLNDGNQATTEVDLYGGYAGKIGDKLSYDVGFIYYWYPGAAKALDYDVWEVYAKTGYDFGPLAVSLGVNYTPDNSGGTDRQAWYLSSGITVPVTKTLSISGGVDYYARKPFANYTDWNVGAKLNVNNWFNIDARYYDTNIKGGCVVPIPGGKNLCVSKAVVTVSRSF